MYKINITTLKGNRTSLDRKFKTKAKAEEFKNTITAIRARKKDKRRRGLLSMNPRIVKINKRSK